jgi:DNA polymerase III delta prime subunit
LFSTWEVQSVNLRQHIELTEKAIAGAFVANGLYVHLCGSVQGPHTLTFGLRLYEPTQKNINKALGLAGAVEAAISDSPIRLSMDRGVILVEAPSPAPVVVEGARLKGQGLAVPLGMTSRQTIAGVDLLANPHLLLVAPTNRGKTTAARLIAYHLAKQNPTRHARFIVSTFKPKDWQAFSHLAHTFAVITEPKEAERMIHHLVGVMMSRTKAGQTDPHLFVFLDDLLNLLGVTSVDDQLAQLASLGRGAGIHLIVCTQRLGEKGAAGGLVTGNIPARLVFGTADAQDSAMFTGRGGSGAEKLGRYPGDALLITDGGVQRLAVGYVADSHLATLKQDAEEWRPWLKHSGTPLLHPASAVLTPTREEMALPAIPGRAEKSVNAGFASETTPPDSPSTESSALAKLPDQPPNAEARQHLRRLYEELGSKNAVMRLVWGGVVNAEGKTPKTKRWLDEALAEVITA